MPQIWQPIKMSFLHYLERDQPFLSFRLGNKNIFSSLTNLLLIFASCEPLNIVFDRYWYLNYQYVLKTYRSIFRPGVNNNINLLKTLLLNLTVSSLMGAAIVRSPNIEYTQGIDAH